MTAFREDIREDSREDFREDILSIELGPRYLTIGFISISDLQISLLADTNKTPISGTLAVRATNIDRRLRCT